MFSNDIVQERMFFTILFTPKNIKDTQIHLDPKKMD